MSPASRVVRVASTVHQRAVTITASATAPKARGGTKVSMIVNFRELRSKSAYGTKRMKSFFPENLFAPVP